MLLQIEIFECFYYVDLKNYKEINIYIHNDDFRHIRNKMNYVIRRILHICCLFWEDN